MTNIVVLGSNFAGINVALGLKKKMPDLDITVIDKNKNFEFYASIHQVISGEKKEESLQFDLAKLYLKKKIKFVNEEVMSFSSKDKSVTTKSQVIKFDYLVNTLGAAINHFNIKGAKENSILFKSIEDAKNIRDRILKLNQTNDRYTIAIAGSGLTGIELIFEIRRFIDRIAAHKKIDVVIIEGKPDICPWANKQTQVFIKKLMEEQRIISKTNFLIKEVNEKTIYGNTDEKINYDLFVWCGGLKINSAVGMSDVAFDNNGLIVNDFLQSASDRKIYSCGDAMSFKFADGVPVPKTAQYADAESLVVIDNIILDLTQKPLKRYVPKKFTFILVALGKHGAILTYKDLLYKSPGLFYQLLKDIIERFWIFSRKRSIIF